MPQFRQFHGFTARTRQTLLRDFPDVYAGLLDAGFGERSVVTGLRALVPDSTPEAGDDAIVHLLGRRSTFEWVLRRAVERSGVNIHIGRSVEGLVRTGSRVTGVRSAGVELPADLVVDATGRRAMADRWLVDVGLPAGQTARSETGIVCYSRWYQLQPGLELQATIIPMDLLSARVMFTPADHGFATVQFSVADTETRTYHPERGIGRPSGLVSDRSATAVVARLRQTSLCPSTSYSPAIWLTRKTNPRHAAISTASAR